MLVTVEGTVTGYFAVEPAVTVSVVEDTVGAEAGFGVESTSNTKELEVPPPGAGVSAVIEVVPALAISAAVTAAVSLLALT